MVSSISTVGLDEDFPVAGRDNDSQGFRDNFANIKTNLGYAKTEIDDLQSGVARKDEDNNFDGNQQSNMLLHLTSLKTAVQTSPTNGGDWELGNVQTYILDNDPLADITIALTNFPSDNYGSIKFFIRNADSSSHTATFTATGFTYFYTDGNAEWSTKTVSIAPDEVVVVNAFSPDGDAMYLQYIGKFA
jgi:hypothetical protein